ncbi:dehydrogenase/reductase SDR family member 7-like [Uloborus diversus]|uniref:dehydrogenase/reductase SDR family member 7-like n=1 Tax=Uloborus diversus TaxID=327109 RepID=UPI00240A4284|nr:dehydrogenase/reductase SDR family member 7-like [Uloborus diversus]
MIPLLEFIVSAIWVTLILLIAWYFLLTDCDLILAFAEKFGRPISAFSGKVVWITGASTGLGEAMAYQLAEVGAKLVLTARSENLLQKVKDECIERSKGKLLKKDILVLPFDLAQFECHEKNVKSVIDHFGRIDVLINNAARYQIGRLIDTDIKVDKAMFDVNFFGPISLTKLVIKQFLSQGKGHIVVISSIAGKFGVPSTASYTGTKHALQGYFEALRTEYQRDKISVTMVCPGIFSSEIFRKTMTTKEDEIFQKDYNHYECLNMTSERCAYLALVASVNKLFESWIAYQPFLFMMWGSQFAPDIYKYIMSLIYNKKRLSELHQGKWPTDLPVWKPLFKGK